jgi:hypothetical protein
LTKARRFWISPPGVIMAFFRTVNVPPGDASGERLVSNPAENESTNS